MSSYPSPIAILPIFNSQEFNYSSSSLSISTADKRYLRLTGGIESGLVTFNGGLSTSTIYNGIGTFTVPSSGLGTLATTNNVVDLSSNQTVGGQKSFSNIATFTTTDGIPGGQAFNITSLTPAYSTRLYSVNNSYSTDLYFPQFNGIDTIVSTASIATMTNKDLSSSTNSFPTNKLGYAQITSNFTTTSVSDVQVTGLTTTVTVPSGGRGVKITVYSEALYISLAGQMYSSLWQGTVGSGTKLQSYQLNFTNSSIPAFGMCMVYYGTPAAGSYTYNVSLAAKTGGGTATMECASTFPAFILVELI